ncbi:hypothetical protein SynROS8604_03415 [Synechococcus sp. ROS8604]|nr:hypothetical protein SynROS8604_03415 [Synechococcus sp. ROS8604]
MPESAIGCIQYDKKQSDLYCRQQKKFQNVLHDTKCLRKVSNLTKTSN